MARKNRITKEVVYKFKSFCPKCEQQNIEIKDEEFADGLEEWSTTIKCKNCDAVYHAEFKNREN